METTDNLHALLDMCHSEKKRHLKLYEYVGSYTAWWISSPDNI